MTDKQIIIDGVDVSGCNAFYINASHTERQECINPYCKGLCKDNPNCYYKQLKRKEQEFKKVQDLFNSTCKCKHLVLDECSLTGKNCIGIKECLYKHQQILQEIKEIAEEIVKTKDWLNCGYNAIKAEQILQKINEVQNG